MIDMTSIKIRAWRKRLGFTQARAAELLGVSIRAIKHWEAGTRRPRKSILLLMAAIGGQNVPSEQ